MAMMEPIKDFIVCAFVLLVLSCKKGPMTGPDGVASHSLWAGEDQSRPKRPPADFSPEDAGAAERKSVMPTFGAPE